MENPNKSSRFEARRAEILRVPPCRWWGRRAGFGFLQGEGKKRSRGEGGFFIQESPSLRIESLRALDE
jgi:hypothetical protein